MKELKLLSEEELMNKLTEYRKQLFELELKKKSGVDKPHLFKQTKRDIARILTLLEEKAKG